MSTELTISGRSDFDALGPYRYRTFRGAPGVVLRTQLNCAEIHINHRLAQVISGKNLQTLCDEIAAGRWIEMSENESCAYRDFMFTAQSIQRAEIDAARKTKPMRDAFAAIIASTALPVSPDENRARIRAVIRTWRG